MKHFISKELIFIKIIILFLILFSLALLIYSTADPINIVKNFKPYYLKAYASAINYKINQNVTPVTQDKAISIPVLLYHGVVGKNDGSNQTLANFTDQMISLKKAGYQTITLEDFYLFAEGKKRLPDKSFLLTFDDGRKDSFYPVDPILKALDYNAVIFVITGVVDKNAAHLTSSELKKMAESGRWEIGSHTMNGHGKKKIDNNNGEGHFLSNKLWLNDKNRIETDEEFRQRITEDLSDAKKFLELKIKKPVLSFAYPFNDYGQESENFPESKNIISSIVQSLYPLSFFQVGSNHGATFNYPQRDISMIKRIDVGAGWDADKLLKKISDSEAKKLPYLDNFDKTGQWIMVRGKIDSSSNNQINLSADTDNTGGTIYLDGASWWKNYHVEATVNWTKGSNIFLLARYLDSSDYVTCNFSNERIRIEQKINNVTTILAEVPIKIDLSGQDINIGLNINKGNIECLLDHQIVSSTDQISPKLATGSVGFETWDPIAGNSEMIIKRVRVYEINK